MLGWDISVYRGKNVVPGKWIASWVAGPFGLQWLDALVKENKVIDLGGNGYPCKFLVSARVLLPMITAGVPAHDKPLVLGDDYVLPEGWCGDIKWRREEVLACHPDELLTIEAWDQS